VDGQQGFGGLGQPDTNTLGNVDAINAPLTVNGEGASDSDRMDIDDSGDTDSNRGTLTGTQVRNGLSGDPGGIGLFGSGGGIPYGTLEILGIHLGDAANGNAFTVESVHGNGSVTAIDSRSGPDVVNIETLAGDLALATGGGNDTVRVGSVTGDIGQINGVLDAFESNLNALRGRLTWTAARAARTR
jgi:hypothetical protein